jgi:hypothetical protein
MITDYFLQTKKKTIITTYYELHCSFLQEKYFYLVHNEVQTQLSKNATRYSCVCISPEYNNPNFAIYDLPKLDWTTQINKIKNQILDTFPTHEAIIDYGLVHYYCDENACIHWHYDVEAMGTPIYSISLGGTRRFCLRDKITKEILTFNLNDGDLFIMKAGCQQKFEHCIKPIKQYDKPRISITFRQIETTICYFVFNPTTLDTTIANEIDTNNTRILATTIQGVRVCQMTKDNICCNIENPTNLTKTNINASLLKSNLQKAIRRGNKQIALKTTATMLENKMTNELLRRLTIISFEDVAINKYYPMVVWYYVVVSSANYNLTQMDKRNIYSYVSLLCNICEFDDYEEWKDDEPLPHFLQEITRNIYSFSLHIREQYGGFNGERKLMNKMRQKIIQNEITIRQNEIQLLQYDTTQMAINEILDCAIDFHCFQKMPQKVLQKIDPIHKLKEQDIRDYIWQFSSNVNYRHKKSQQDEHRKKIWETVVKPKCQIYQFYIKKWIGSLNEE